MSARSKTKTPPLAAEAGDYRRHFDSGYRKYEDTYNRYNQQQVDPSFSKSLDQEHKRGKESTNWSSLDRKAERKYDQLKSAELENFSSNRRTSRFHDSVSPELGGRRDLSSLHLPASLSGTPRDSSQDRISAMRDASRERNAVGVSNNRSREDIFTTDVRPGTTPAREKLSQFSQSKPHSDRSNYTREDFKRDIYSSSHDGLKRGDLGSKTSPKQKDERADARFSMFQAKGDSQRDEISPRRNSKSPSTEFHNRPRSDLIDSTRDSSSYYANRLAADQSDEEWRPRGRDRTPPSSYASTARKINDGPHKTNSDTSLAQLSGRTEARSFDARSAVRSSESRTSAIHSSETRSSTTVPRSSESQVALAQQQHSPKPPRRSESRRTVTSRLDSDEERDSSKTRAKKKRRRTLVTVNLSGTRYDVVRQMCELHGMAISREEDANTFLIWNDSFVSTERISELKPFQRINHFPGMGEICRKDCLARNMAKVAKKFPDEFNFVPKTWIFPQEHGTFLTYARELKKKKKHKAFIIKPSNGAMGNGIYIMKNPEKIPSNEHIIVQEYLDKPFLVDGYKCDLRIYVLMTSCDPLRLFLYHDGLLRMGTEKYVPPTEHNVDNYFMHLTNYSINKHNEHYHKSGTVDTGSKRTLKFFNDYLRRHDYDVAYIWRNITDILVKTLVVAQPHVLHAYRMCRPGQAPGSEAVCFELLGFDVMLDRKLRPWLVEVNRSPSFGTDEKLDFDIKSGVVDDTLKLLNIKPSDRKRGLLAQKAQAQKRLMRQTRRDIDVSELEKKKMCVERKKDELKEMLLRIRKDAMREDFENRNSGGFKRIFPPDDKFQREHYATLLAETYGACMQGAGRGPALKQEIQRVYNNKLREEDLLDMLAQCEADEKEGKLMTTARPRGPKPLIGMPVLSKEKGSYDDDSDEEAEDEVEETPKRVSTSQKPKVGAQSANVMKKNEIRTQEEELTRRTLASLNDMKIKFPGKTDDEAEFILDKLHENWKFHKPRIASYWLVKLDSIKRRKVIDIVRSNVRAVLQRVYRVENVETLRLYRLFNRVFNRLLWSHGQGLWNCFQTIGNSWETIFSKSTDSVSASEMACCRRIVQLCRDCLLIVYQFASAAKSANQQHDVTESSPLERQDIIEGTFGLTDAILGATIGSLPTP